MFGVARSSGNIYHAVGTLAEASETTAGEFLEYCTSYALNLKVRTGGEEGKNPVTADRPENWRLEISGDNLCHKEVHFLCCPYYSFSLYFFAIFSLQE